MIPEGLRKFAFAFSVFSTAALMTALGAIPATAFESITWGCLLMYGGGNVGEHFAKRRT